MAKTEKVADVYRKVGEVHKKEKSSFWGWVFFAVIAFIVLGAIAG